MALWNDQHCSKRGHMKVINFYCCRFVVVVVFASALSLYVLLFLFVVVVVVVIVVYLYCVIQA